MQGSKFDIEMKTKVKELVMWSSLWLVDQIQLKLRPCWPGTPVTWQNQD